MMDIFTWRKCAFVVSVVDCAMMAYGMGMAYETISTPNSTLPFPEAYFMNKTFISEDEQKLIEKRMMDTFTDDDVWLGLKLLAMILLLLVFMLVIATISLPAVAIYTKGWSIYSLMAAVNTGMTPVDAKANCHFWRKVTIIQLMVACMNSWIQWNFTPVIIARVVMLFIVHKFEKGMMI